jgi:uncharacterized oligopeptide transporter (OPT) family protein
LKVFEEEYKISEIPEKHPSIFEFRMVVFGVLFGLLGVIIGLELLTRVGVTPNTSIIGAIIAIAVSRIPVTVLKPFQNLHQQNLIQTLISGATFGGANSILVPIGILWLIGKPELVPIMMIGAVLGLFIDATIMYKVFDSRIFPALGIWPPGIATAECLIAGEMGGRRARLLVGGGVIGAVGRYCGVPMEIFGVAWIGNVWAMGMLSLGLLLRGYSTALLGYDINEIYLPHGVMIGAGSVALIQIIVIIAKNGKDKMETAVYSSTGREFGRRIAGAFFAFIAAASVMAAAVGIYTKMTPVMLVGFIFFAGAAALISELIVGIAAMHSGWFPAFATTLIFLVIGMLIGFPPVPLALLVGFTASVGPAFADMGFDLKTGWILRGSGKYPEFEKQGRKQQYYAELFGFVVAVLFVVLFYKNYFTANLFPPVDRVFVSTIFAGANYNIAYYLLIWMIPGAVIQIIGGPARQIGILFATGLLIMNPPAGWTVLIALIIRGILVKKYGISIHSTLYVLAGGFIAGSALCSFGTATLKLK